MNKKCLLIFTIAISFEIFSEEVKITQEYLLNSEANISFEKNTFEISTGYGGWASGTYRIENNTIVIVPNNINYYGLEYLQNKEIHYKVIRQKNSIYTDSFVCIDNYKGIDPIKSFVNRSSRLPEGSLIKIKPDIEVILLEEYLAEVNDNVNIRDYPSLKGNKFIIEFRDSGDKPFKYLPKGKKVFVKGRTKNKYKINDKINYWYMIYPFLDEYDYMHLEDKSIKPKTEHNWIYGEFLEKSKTDFPNYK